MGWAAAVVLLVALGLRVHNLGGPALRGDTLHYWRICNSELTGWQIVTKWTELGVGQLPLPLAVTKFAIDVLNLPVTHATIRIGDVAFGMLLVWTMMAAGRRLGGPWCGVVAGLFTALNPFHIQTSTEGYFYASLMLGAGLCLLAYLQAVQAVEEERATPRTFLWTAGAGFILIAYSQVTGWLLLAIYCALILWLLVQRWRRTRRYPSDVWSAVAVWGVLGAPLLVVSWGLPHNLSKITSSAGRDVARSGLAVAGGDPWSLITRSVTSFGWGNTPLRAVLTLAVLALAVWAIWRAWRSRAAVRWIPFLFVANFVLFVLTRGLTDAMYESRYIGGLLPLYLLILAFGVVAARDLPGVARLPPGARHAAAAAVLAVCVLAWARPAWAVSQLKGAPAPYKEIQQTVDALLPAGTPVLVDRWFEPWNEMVPYPSTNRVVFTFTVPNEPIEQFLRVQWRATAQQFFARHPDAAYLELAKTYWEIPTVGPWAWPRQFFARHVSISNEAGLYLRELGLAARGDYYSATTNRLVVDLFYNTREDIMRRMQQTGTKLLPWYGKGWRFEKSGPMAIFRVQTQDFRDWRVLEENVELELINLATQAVPVFVTVRGASVGGAKTVQVTPDLKHSFPPSQVTNWRFGPLVLQPGINILPLNDPLWRLSQNPLLVDHVAMEEAPAGTDLGSAIAPRRAGQ